MKKGINTVTFYSTDIFIDAELEGSWPAYGTIILGFVQVAATIACMLLIDKVGRKFLLLVGFAFVGLFSFLMAICRIYGVRIYVNML